jgi:hypothetical protein
MLAVEIDIRRARKRRTKAEVSDQRTKQDASQRDVAQKV